MSLNVIERILFSLLKVVGLLPKGQNDRWKLLPLHDLLPAISLPSMSAAPDSKVVRLPSGSAPSVGVRAVRNPIPIQVQAALCIVDSGPSDHITSRRYLISRELKTMRKSETHMIFQTANKMTHADEILVFTLLILELQSPRWTWASHLQIPSALERTALRPCFNAKWITIAPIAVSWSNKISSTYHSPGAPMVGRKLVLSLFFALSPNVSREDVALLLRQPSTTVCKAPLQQKSGADPPNKCFGAGLAVRGILTTLARRVPLGTRRPGGVFPVRTML